MGLKEFVNKNYGSKESNSNKPRIDENDRTPEEFTMSEADKSAFLTELEGSNADIEDIASFKELLKHPLPGSLIEVFKDPKRRNKSYLVSFATDSFIPNILPILFSDDIPMEIYVLFRLVVPHKKAIAVAEQIGELAREHKMSATAVLGEISGLDIKQRSDLKKVLSSVLNYHPHIGQTLSSFLKKVDFSF